MDNDINKIKNATVTASFHKLDGNNTPNNKWKNDYRRTKGNNFYNGSSTNNFGESSAFDSPRVNFNHSSDENIITTRKLYETNLFERYKRDFCMRTASEERTFMRVAKMPSVVYEPIVKGSGRDEFYL